MTAFSKGTGTVLCDVNVLNKWQLTGKRIYREMLMKPALTRICIISKAFCLQFHWETIQNSIVRGLNFFSLFYYPGRNLTNDKFHLGEYIKPKLWKQMQ